MVSLPHLQPRRSGLSIAVSRITLAILYSATGFVALVALRALWWAAGRLLGLPYP